MAQVFLGMLCKGSFKNFSEIMKDLSPSKLYHVSMDGPNVDLKFLKELSKLRVGDSVRSLVDIGTCSLHSVHGSMKTGEIASKWELKKIMKSVYTIMHKSLACREDCLCFRIETLPTKLLCNPVWFCFWIFLVTEVKMYKTL